MIGSSTDNHLKYVSGSKRPYEAMNQEGSSGEIFQVLPLECLNHILSFLSREQLLVFEQLNRQTSAGFYTQYQWKIICLQKKFNFDWEDLKNYNECKHDKIRFMMGQGLCHYAFSRLASRLAFMDQSVNWKERSPEGSQAFASRYHRFAYLHKFPSLKAYIAQDIKTQAEEIDQNFSSEGFDQKLSLSKELKAGDQLLRGLYHLGKGGHGMRGNRPIKTSFSNEPFKRAEEDLGGAIQKGALLASFIAIRSGLIGSNFEFVGFAKLADLSIEKQHIKDYSGLHLLVFNSSPQKINNYFKDRTDPPILEFRAMELQKQGASERGDKVFKEAIEAYGEHILPQTWVNYSRFKHQWSLKQKNDQWSLKQKNELLAQAYGAEALEYINRAIAAYGEDVPCAVLLLRMFLCKNLQTEEYAKELIQTYPNQKAEFRQRWLEEYKNNPYEEFCNKWLKFALLTYDKKEAPLPLLFAQVFNQVKKYDNEETKTLFKNALAIYKERKSTPSVEVLFTTAYMYFKEGVDFPDSLPLNSLWLYRKATLFLDQANNRLAEENRADYFLTMTRVEMLSKIKELKEDISCDINDLIDDSLKQVEDPFDALDLLPDE